MKINDLALFAVKSRYSIPREYNVYYKGEVVATISFNTSHYNADYKYSAATLDRNIYVHSSTIYGCKKKLFEELKKVEPSVPKNNFSSEYLPSFDREFYPTPGKLAGKMISMIDLTKVKTVLEPSAGKGDLAECLVSATKKFSHGNNIDLDCIEIDENLRYILNGKGFRVVHDDFLTFSTGKRYDLIIMNPPFSNGDEHLLKAISLMEHGGQIVCLLNAETLRNFHTNRRKLLNSKLCELDAKTVFLADEFKNAERKTGVDVAIVYIDIPAKKYKSEFFERMQKAEQRKHSVKEPTQLVRNNWVAALLEAFKVETAAGEKLLEEYYAMQDYCLPDRSPYAAPIISIGICGKESSNNLDNLINTYLEHTRRKYWDALLSQPQITEKLTSQMQSEYSSKISELAKYDFTEYNVQQILIEVNGQLSRGVDEEISALFEKLSAQHSWFPECDKNIHYFNGWATNKAHKINKKVILPINGFSAYSWRNKDCIDEYSVYSTLKDIEMTLNYLDKGRTYPIDLSNVVRCAASNGQTKNIECKYFFVTFYKKGTAHITFKDQRLLDCLNIYAARKRGWLPPSYGKQKYEDMPPEEKSIVDAFQGSQSYERVLADKEYYLSGISTNQFLIQGVKG